MRQVYAHQKVLYDRYDFSGEMPTDLADALNAESEADSARYAYIYVSSQLWFS